jgi:hypothetical protein
VLSVDDLQPRTSTLTQRRACLLRRGALRVEAAWLQQDSHRSCPAYKAISPKHCSSRA